MLIKKGVIIAKKLNQWMVLERDSFRKDILERYKIVGISKEMIGIKEYVRKYANTDLNVLITGETGTGKELIGRNIHFLSFRAAGDFVKVNCSAIPDSLIESELFGYKKVKFTGAYTTKKGFLK